MAVPHDESPPARPVFQTVQPTSMGQLRLLRIGDVELELDAHQVRVSGTTVKLPLREFEILNLLMDNAGRIVSRGELLDRLWGPGNHPLHNSLDVHINRLRHRLRTPGRPERIRTIRGLGYIFDLPVPEPPT